MPSIHDRLFMTGLPHSTATVNITRPSLLRQRCIRILEAQARGEKGKAYIRRVLNYFNSTQGSHSGIPDDPPAVY